MVYRYRVSLAGLKGFARVYELKSSMTLYDFHLRLRDDLDFAHDQLIQFKALDNAGGLVARYGLFNLGAGAVDEVSLADTVEKGVASFIYFYDVTNRKSVIVTFEGESEEVEGVEYPRLIETKGPNPIDFENAEGNLGLANAIFEHLSHKLPISRLQRDLTDSTVSRNIGVPVAHTLISLASLQKGLDKLLLNEEAIARDLENNWAVVAEAVQTILRSVGYPNPYEALKQLTRTNQKVTAQTIADFVETLDVDASVKERIRSITPHNYLGYKLFND